MQPANISAVLGAIVVAAACWAACGLLAATAAEPSLPAAVAQAEHEPAPQPSGALSDRDIPSELVARTRALLTAAYAKAPALVIALGAMPLLPVAALASLLWQASARRRANRAARQAVAARPLFDEARGAEPAPLWTYQAWLSREDDGSATMPLGGQMIRIGRHQDNDIQLPDASVHRYHAVIEHTSEEAFFITDLSGKGGNGLRVNGARLARAQLADGDVIELGHTRLKFESVPV